MSLTVKCISGYAYLNGTRINPGGSLPSTGTWSDFVSLDPSSRAELYDNTQTNGNSTLAAAVWTGASAPAPAPTPAAAPAPAAPTHLTIVSPGAGAAPGAAATAAAAPAGASSAYLQSYTPPTNSVYKYYFSPSYRWQLQCPGGSIGVRM